jgi:hypothetical protein
MLGKGDVGPPHNLFKEFVSPVIIKL